LLCSLIWVELAKRIKQIDRLLVEQAKDDPLDAVYRSVPGVGALISRILSAELVGRIRAALRKHEHYTLDYRAAA